MQRGPNDRRPSGARRGRGWTHLLGDFLLLAGVVSLLLAGYSYFTDLSSSGLSLPRPVALAGAPEAVLEEPTALPPTSTPVPPTPEPTRPQATSAPTMTPTITPTPTATPVPAGAPVRMVVPSIFLILKSRMSGRSGKGVS